MSAKFQTPRIVSRAVNEYVLKHGFRESKVAEKLRLATANHESSVMMGDPTEASMFKVLLPAMGAKNIIEVGVYTGYTTLVMADAVGPEGKIVALDVNDDYAKIGKPFWKEAGVDDRIDLRIGPAKDSLQSMVDEVLHDTFDFAFIDADKPGYIEYYELLMKLVRKNGIIAIDNVFWSGDVFDESITDSDTVALRNITQHVKKDDRVDHVMLPFADGVTLVRKK
uniref:Caffeoyl-CoA O-methyltransferase n=1 Tax=Craspedostauros australis TaxID=1486917 RepID=A0A7R9ZP85_9STRA